MLGISQLIIKEGINIIAIKLQSNDFFTSRKIGQYLVFSASIGVGEQGSLGLSVHQAQNILLCVFIANTHSIPGLESFR